MSISRAALLGLGALTACGGNAPAPSAQVVAIPAAASAAPTSAPLAQPSAGGTRALSFGGQGTQGEAIALTPDGGILFAGSYRGPIDFGGERFGGNNVPTAFVAKLDGSMRHTWSMRVRGTGRSVVNGLALDARGNAIAAGDLVGESELAPEGVSGGFVMVLDPSGKIAQKKILPNAEHVLVAANGPGDIALSSTSKSRADLGGGPSAPGCVVAKLDGRGGHRWTRNLGPSTFGLALAMDAQGNVLVTGRFEKHMEIDGRALTGGALYDAFLCKLSAGDGKASFCRRIGGRSYHRFVSLAVDATNRIVAAGDCTGPTDLEERTIPGDSTVQQPCVFAFDPDGRLAWERRFGQDAEDRAQRGGGIGTAVAIGAHREVALAGHFYGTIDFGSGPQKSSKYDAFVAWLDPTGRPTAGRRIGDVEPRAVALDAAGAAILTGSFGQATDFGGMELTPDKGRSMFLLRTLP